MNNVTEIIAAIVDGDPQAAEQLLPLVYGELRALAARRLANEPPGQTLQPTALVHEAYMRLIGSNPDRRWEGRAHFFGAAAEAMRRILVENARRKQRLRHGGSRKRVDLDDSSLLVEPASDDVLAVNEALDGLKQVDSEASELVKLRYFGGLGAEEAGEVLGLSPRSTFRCWAFAKAWLYSRLHEHAGGPAAGLAGGPLGALP
jgi:RNA polymerase sigma factor (TIGR02999 family)